MQNSRTVTMAQKIIPAHAGFRVATIYFDGVISESTSTADLAVMYEPIIGWVVAPVFKHDEGSEIPEIVDSGVEPLILDGKLRDGSFIVDPHGVWHLPYDRVLEGEEAARRHWLSLARPSSGDTPDVAPWEE